MLLNENLFETLDMTKDAYLRDAAELSWETGHPYDPDDFSYFKRVCAEDGYDVTEEDFQKYWDYFEECRPMMNTIQRDNQSFGPWKEMESKQVEDSDGFMTDYTWYVKDNDDGSETHIMIFGDKDVYHPLNSEPDAEFDGEEVAREWFDNYKGFEDEEEVIDEDVVINESSWAENSYTWGKARQPKIDAIFEAGLWEDFEDAVLEASDIVVGLHTDIYHIQNNAARTEPPYITDADIKEAKKLIFKLCDEYYEKAIAKNDELEEAVKPDIESEELKALAQKHNIKILDAMSNGDLRMEGAGADLMKFYQEAEKLGLWQVSPELYEAKISISKAEIDKLDKEVEEATREVAQYNIKLKKLSDGSTERDFSETPADQIEEAKAALDRYNKAIKARPDRAKDIITYTEALHGKEELDEFTQLANKLGFTTMAQMQHIMNAAKSLGKSELDMLKSVDETFDSKIPDKLIDGLTDTFLVEAEKLGFNDEDYKRFLKWEVEPGETITQAILRYKDEIADLDLPESKLEEIAVLNIDESAIFDAIANAKAYIQEKKYSQAKDSLTFAANLLSEPINESSMSNLDYEIREAGGRKNWKEKAKAALADMIENLKYLKTYAPKEVNAGGNYDSIEELQTDIEDLEKTIDDLSKKIDYVESIKTIGGDQE